MKALVTGSSGFVGRFLVKELTAASWEITTVGGFDGADRARNFAKSLKQNKPDVVFHLAGVTRADHNDDFYLANTVLVAQLLDAVSALARPPLVILAGSAAEYGVVPPEAVPVSEDTQCRPVTHYAISKYAQTLMGLRYAAAGQSVIVARIWNPVGAGMPSHLSLANFAAQISSMPSEGGELRVGNLEVERDFIDVREVARLLVALSECSAARGRVVNVCSGRVWSLRSLVEAMIRLANRPITLTVDAGRLRQGETQRLCGDTHQLIALGLQPLAPDFDRILPELMLSVAN
jgi:GDP-4-dehydro-6-deoxy-D-mannose reductase